MKVYYNEINKDCIAATYQLIKDGFLPKGDIDERPIQEIKSEDLKWYDQCHFFNGLGGWPFALRIAGFNDPCWTGSAPCQGESRAGKKKRDEDPRHLWPAFFRHIEKCKPPKVFGEQVEAAVTSGWLDTVACDLESAGYAFGSAVLSSLAVQGVNKGERIFFVGEAKHYGWDEAEIARSLEETVYGGKERKNRTGKFEGASSPGMLSASVLEWRGYPDGKTRPIDPGICMLGDEFPTRISEICAFGNALDPYLAAEFVRATA